MLNLFARLLVILAIGGCQLSPLRSDRDVVAEIAGPAKMQEQLRAGGPFVLTTRERLSTKGQDLTIYLEGDGVAWISRSRPSPDPTPDDPVALRLAALDGSPNVAWIARPCQYTPMERNPECRTLYWTNGRFAKPVVDATDAVITSIKQVADAGRIHLVGYSGGGGLAVLVAARRNDVASIRTLAGNLDHRTFTSHHGVSPMDQSLNPADDAKRVQAIPQTHWVGGEDKTVPPVIAQSFLRQMGDTRCALLQIAPDTTHTKGWERHWMPLSLQRPTCQP